MNRLSCLDRPVFRGFYSPPLDLELREIIVHEFWGISADNGQTIFNTYFAIYQNACESQLPNEHAIETHRHLLDVVKHLKQERLNKRAQIRASLCAISPRFQAYSPCRIDKSLDIAIRLWLMVRVSNGGGLLSGQSMVHWIDNQSYTDAIKNTFQKASRRQLGRLNFSHEFTAYNLVRLGGFRIKWTWNLADHLLLNKGGQILLCHLVGPLEALVSTDYLPEDLAEETLRTLAVLFPRANIPAHRWTERVIEAAKDRKEYIEPRIGDRETTSLEVESFKYWKHRLLALEEAFDRSEPFTISQWWHDRRKRREWATFWIAFLVLVLTVIFGFIQSITGIVQAYASMKGLQLQVASANE